MSEDDRNFSKDAYDLNENYSYNEQPYQSTDKIDDEGILRKREEKELEDWKKKENEDFKRDKKFYHVIDTKKTDEGMIQRDVKRDFDFDKRGRKSSLEIARDVKENKENQ